MRWVRIHTADNPIEAGFLRGLLEAAGIPVQLRSMDLWTAAVEIYFAAGARPSVWVPANKTERARAVLAEQADPRRRFPDWRCTGCGQTLEGQFTECWNCGSSRNDRR